MTSLAAASAVPEELRAQSAPLWNGGDLVHLLPTVSDERMLIKASFSRALAKPPRLLVDKRAASTRRTDSSGEHWSSPSTDCGPRDAIRCSSSTPAGKDSPIPGR